MNKECIEVNYSEIQRSQFAVLSKETIVTHSNAMYESYFSEKMPQNDPHHYQQVFLIEYF